MHSWGLMTLIFHNIQSRTFHLFKLSKEEDIMVKTCEISLATSVSMCGLLFLVQVHILSDKSSFFAEQIETHCNDHSSVM